VHKNKLKGIQVVAETSTYVVKEMRFELSGKVKIKVVTKHN